MKKEITHSWFYSYPPETIWEYLTSSELLSQWLMKNDFKPVAGHRFMFKSGPAPQLEFDGNVYCEVLEIEPLKKLSYSWKYGSGPGDTRIDSVVTWSLSAKDNGTELLLVHTGVDEAKHLPDYNAMNAGWLANIKKIEKILSTKTADETTSH